MMVILLAQPQVNVHCSFGKMFIIARITLDDESSSEGVRPKAADTEPSMLLSGPDRWNKQPTGLVRVAIEASEAFGVITMHSRAVADRQR